MMLVYGCHFALELPGRFIDNVRFFLRNVFSVLFLLQLNFRRNWKKVVIQHVYQLTVYPTPRYKESVVCGSAMAVHIRSASIPWLVRVDVMGAP